MASIIMKMQATEDLSRLGYLLTEEETDKIFELAVHLGIMPGEFVTHCIDTMWSKLHGIE